jgi:uncharacterized protein
VGLKPISIYLDSCLVIYLIEEHPIFAPLLENHIANTQSFIFVVSHLTEMECLIMPIRNNNQLLTDKFRDWFKQVEVFYLNETVFHQAAQLRADSPGLKTPDALHIATAQYHSCDEFWTNDNRLDKIAPSLVKNIFTT